MSKHTEILGDIVKKKRLELGLTQSEVAEMIDVDNRTILHIENHKGNPKWEILYPLVRALEIDPSALFYPELDNHHDEIARFNLLLSKCSAEELQMLYPICQTILAALHAKSSIVIKTK